MSLVRNERSDRTGPPKKSPKVAPSKRNIALFLYSSTITMAFPKVMTVFGDRFVLEDKKVVLPIFLALAPLFVRPSLIMSFRIRFC